MLPAITKTRKRHHTPEIQDSSDGTDRLISQASIMTGSYDSVSTPANREGTILTFGDVESDQFVDAVSSPERKLSLNEFLEVNVEEHRKNRGHQSASVHDSTLGEPSEDYNIYESNTSIIQIRFDDDEIMPLSKDEIGMLRSLLKRPRMPVSSSSEEQSTLSVDTETREKTVKSKLSADTFSFLIASPVASTPFITGLFVLMLKTFIFGLISANLIDADNSNNPLGIPTSVTGPVIVAQFLALLIAVATQDDIVTGLNLLDEGYDIEFMRRAHPAATKTKWLAGIVSLFLTGMFGLSVTFMLVVTSNEVVELMLNFTAIEFVSLLDNVCFELASKGLLGKVNKLKADEIEENEYRVPKSRKVAHQGKQITTLLTSFAILCIGWTVVYTYQISGKFTPSTLVIQLDDEVVLELGAYSGTYELRNRPLSVGFGRIRYFSVDGPGVFGYCEDNEVWTFTLEGGSNGPCDNVLVRSSPTQSFDILESTGNPWFVTSNVTQSRFFPMENFHLSTGCDIDSDCGGVDHGVCNDRNKCICNEGYFGISCDFVKSSVCTTLELDQESLSEQGVRRYSKTYSIVQTEEGVPLEVYNRNVYVSAVSGREEDILLFIGLRWILTQIPHHLNITTKDDLISFLSKPKTHIAQTLLMSESYLMSAPLWVNTPGDIATPFNLEWFPVTHLSGGETRMSAPVNLDIFCAVCDSASNPCRFSNVCQADGTCSCENGAFGTLCQNAPVADGKCHYESFNDPGFNYDGGDCCEFSCVNNGNTVCGVVDLNGVDNLFVGFPHCQDAFASCPEADRCFMQKSRPITSLSGHSEAFVTLSNSGRTIAIAEPDLDTVRVFDQADSSWLQRGSSLEGIRRSQFGRQVALTRSPGEIVGLPNGNLPLIIAVSFKREDQAAAARVVSWMQNKQEWRQISRDINVCRGSGCEVTAIDVVKRDDVVTLAASTRSHSQVDRTLVYTAISNSSHTGDWNLVFSVDGSHGSLSEGGQTLTFASPESAFIHKTSIQSASRSGHVNLDDGYDHMISIHDLREFGDNSTITALKTSDDSKYISVFLERTVQGSSLLRFDDRAGRPRPHAGTILPSVQDHEVPIVDFSNDGSIASIVLDVPGRGRFVRVVKFNEQSLRWDQIGDDVAVSSRSQEFAVSFDGKTLVVGGDSPTDVYGMREECLGSEFQFSFTMDDAPTNISWSMHSMKFLGGIEIPTDTNVEECDHCYGDSFVRAMLAKKGCVPNDECFYFRFENDNTFSDGAGFVFFVDGLEHTTLNSHTGRTFEIYLHDKEACSLNALACQDGQSVLTVVLDLDGNAHETTWYLRDGQNRVLHLEENYSTAERDIQQFCVPSNGCYSLTFEDSAGDGFCCNSGRGSYAVYLGQDLLHKHDADFGFGERLFFGACEEVTALPVQAEIVFSYDPFEGRPNETTWTVVDAAGRTVSSGGPYNDFQNEIVQERVVEPTTLPCYVETAEFNKTAEGMFVAGDVFDIVSFNETYVGGRFINGTFVDSDLSSGVFVDGSYDGGTFSDGMFGGGSFWGGTYIDGVFVEGTIFNGTFLSGTFISCTFVNGLFLDGDVYDGTIVDGAFIGTTFVVEEIEGTTEEAKSVDGLGSFSIIMSDDLLPTLDNSSVSIANNTMAAFANATAEPNTTVEANSAIQLIDDGTNYSSYFNDSVPTNTKINSTVGLSRVATFVNVTIVEQTYNLTSLYNQSDFLVERFDLLTSNVSIDEVLNVTSLANLWTCLEPVRSTFANNNASNYTEAESPSGFPPMTDRPSVSSSLFNGSMFNESMPDEPDSTDLFGLCNTTYESAFDVCGTVLNYTELFDYFREPLDFVDLFGEEVGTNFTPLEPDPIIFRETFHMYMDEIHNVTVFDRSGNGIKGSFQISYYNNGAVPRTALLSSTQFEFNTTISFSLSSESQPNTPPPVDSDVITVGCNSTAQTGACNSVANESSNFWQV